MARDALVRPPRSRRLALEPLEDRLLLAGNVTVGLFTLSGTAVDVNLNGDSAANDIAVSTTGGQLTIEGLNGTTLSPGAINIPLPILAGAIVATDGSTFVTFNSTFSDLLEDLTINLGAGDDQVSVNNVPVDDNLVIDTNGGNDTVIISNTEVDDSISIDTGGGNDVLIVSTTTTEDGDWSINLGAGADTLDFETSASSDDMSILAGSGNDELMLSQIIVVGDLSVATLGGDDAFLLSNSLLLGDTFVDMGAGNDEFVNHQNTYGDNVGPSGPVVFQMGPGNDYLVSGGNRFLNTTTVAFNGAAGDDIVVALDSTPIDQFVNSQPAFANWELIDETIVDAFSDFIVP